MLVTLFGIVTDTNDSQNQKAQLPILVTLSGITMLFSFEQHEKAWSPMLVTLYGITYEVASCRLNAIILSLFLVYNTPSS